MGEMDPTVAAMQAGMVNDSGRIEPNATPKQAPTKAMGKNAPPTKPKPEQRLTPIILQKAIKRRQST